VVPEERPRLNKPQVKARNGQPLVCKMNKVAQGPNIYSKEAVRDAALTIESCIYNSQGLVTYLDGESGTDR
jgi:hypothetical protein